MRQIRMLREAAGLTQEQLAKKVGISQVALHELETGATRMPRLDNAFALAAALRISVEELKYALDNEAPEPAPTAA